MDPETMSFNKNQQTDPEKPRKNARTLSSHTLNPKHFPRKETTIAAHLLDDEELEVIFDTSITKGLTETVAENRLKTNGPNALPKRTDLTYLKLFIQNMFGWFPSMLWLSGFLAISIHFVQFATVGIHHTYENLQIGVVILMVVAFSGLFGFYQEAKNVRVIKGFKDIMPSKANVKRNGEIRTILAEELVVGDVVPMDAGELVPADVKLIAAHNFKIDMSSITGESEPQYRSVKYTSENPMETRNLAFSSCQIIEGSATGVVVATGEKTVIGRIAELTTGLEKEESPISAEIKRFIKIITAIAILFGVIFFVMVTLVQDSFIIGFYYMIGIIIANVPEGLIVTLTIALTLTAVKLKKKNCLMKRLQSAETLGAVSCICSDKTGTLTENKMAVSHLAYDNEIKDCADSMDDDVGFQLLSNAACLCLRAEFVDDGKIRGDSSETAILKYMEEMCYATEVREKNPKLCEIPFNSVNKYQLSIHLMEGTKTHKIVMKGAPEVVMKLCDSVSFQGNNLPMDDSNRLTWSQLCTKLGRMGERVLGYCDFNLPVDTYPVGYKFDSEKINFPMNGFRFLGLISLIDPPRSSVPEAIRRARLAGIKVHMITGDHPITALSIARKVGIVGEKSVTPYDMAFELGMDPQHFARRFEIIKDYRSMVLTGEDLRDMEMEDLDSITASAEEIVFARTTPQQKLTIVESCQRNGHVVAVTGDGVNDSPALRKADVGIAMNITGTEVSKQAADVILIDDNFSSIVLGIQEGRLIYENLKKSIRFTLTSNIPEMIPFILYAAFGIPLPLHALLIIAVDVVTDIWPAMSLVYEKAEADIMKNPPRDLSSDHLLSRNLITMAYFQVGIIESAASMAGYFIAMACYGFFPNILFLSRKKWDDKTVNDFRDSFDQEWTYKERIALEKLAQTTYFATLIVVQLFDCLVCKTRRLSLFQQGMSNWMLNAAMLACVALSMIIIYVPFCNKYLNTMPIPWIFWVIGLPFGITLFVFDEIRKCLLRRNHFQGWIYDELFF